MRFLRAPILRAAGRISFCRNWTEMIAEILHIIETSLTRICPQIESRSCSAWQSEFLFIQEKSRLTLAPIGQDKLPRCDFSSVPYDTLRSPYDASARCPVSSGDSRFSSI